MSVTRLSLGLWLALAVVLPAPAEAQSPDARPTTPYSRENQLDLNRATRAELEQLPISAELAGGIYEFRTYRKYFENVFDLLEVEGLTPEILERIRPLVFITPVFEVLEDEQADEEQRVQERYYLVQRLLSEEGSNEGKVDEYIDRIKEPKNVNRMGFYEMISYQNVSPVDAVAIIKERAQSGRIENQRQMRSSPGVSYWGYRNLRDYVRYDDAVTTQNEFHGDYQIRMYNTPYLLDDAETLNEVLSDNNTNYDENTYAGQLNIRSAQPFLTNKLRLRWGPRIKFSLLTHRNMGEEDFDETLKFSLSGEDFNDVETPLGRFKLNRAVAGNFRLAFGQGLIMDSTDFYQPRQTGYGYSARAVGLRSDISRNDEFTLRGGAVEATLGNVRGTFFYSRDDKDAILNPDGSFNRYFTMVPRISNDVLDEITDDLEDETGFDPDAYLPMRDVMDEQVAGANLKYEFVPGTYLGLTGMEMRYDNNEFDTPGADRWNPNPGTLLLDLGRMEDRDSEIGAGYNSVNIGDYRRIWGAEAQTVFENVSLAAEYGKLETTADEDKSSLDRIFTGGPEAMVANAYVQYENFNLLAIYRDYDIGYDNPYNRGFSEDSRFEQTILDGNAFRLKNPYWAQLAMGNPQPKSEQGWFFSTRYQFTRQFTLSGLEYDTWKRKADGADLRRATIRAEYRPVFPVRFRIRHRISSRHEQQPDDIRRFTSWDSRIEMRANLSQYDQVRFLYSTSSVEFAPRPRLNAPADGGDTSMNEFPVRGLPAKALQGMFTHNFNEFLTVTLSTEVYDGFLYNFEDNEFVVVDGNGFRNWVLVRSRLSDRLSWRLKWTTDHQLARTYVDVRNFGQNPAGEPSPDATNGRDDYTSYRFQLDYSF